MHASTQYGPVPLILGVAGHRDIRRDDVPALEAAVRNELAAMRRNYPSTRIVVLSPLAEGSDRLVARVALELHLSLVVAMPLPQDEFEKDFATPESVREFRELLARADHSFTVPWTGGAVEPASRDAIAYARCAVYVVTHCVELIALWDGTNDGAMGGTAESVTFQLEGIPAPYVPESSALDPALTGPVLHVATRRESRETANTPSASGDAIVVRRIFPPGIPEADPSKAWAKLKDDVEAFNRDAVRMGFAGIHPELDAARERVDAVARLYQQRFTRALTAIFALVFLATAGFNVYSFLPQHPLWLLLAFLALTGAAVATYHVTRRQGWKDRYQDARALAEALRVAWYWQLAGVEESVATRFADAQQLEVDWLPPAIRALAQPLGVFPQRADVRANFQRVYDEWIVGQIDYFTCFAGRREHAHKVISTRTATMGLVCSIALSIATLPLSGLGIPEALDRVFSMAATIVAVGAGLLHGYADKRGWSEHARRYDRIALVFTRARERVAAFLQEGRFSEARRVLRRLGEEAIRESVSWLSLQRTRRIDVPHA